MLSLKYLRRSWQLENIILTKPKCNPYRLIKEAPTQSRHSLQMKYENTAKYCNLMNSYSKEYYKASNIPRKTGLSIVVTSHSYSCRHQQFIEQPQIKLISYKIISIHRHKRWGGSLCYLDSHTTR